MTGMETLPEDVLIAVLVLVPARDLMLHCRLVCSFWRELVDLPLLWRLKCQRAGYWPEPLDSPIPDWRHFYFLCSLKMNLIKNPCAEEGLGAWKKESDGGNGWKIQQIPGDHRRNFFLPHVQKYFVTSYDKAFLKSSVANNRALDQSVIGYKGLQESLPGCRRNGTRSCMKWQLITLRDHGYWDQLMDEARPDIVVTDWYVALFDRGCQYQLSVRLLSEDYVVLREFVPEPVVIEQWSNGEWHKVSHTFHNYPAGVRYILFSHGGQDTQFWAGWYGVAVTNSSLTLGPQVAD